MRRLAVLFLLLIWFMPLAEARLHRSQAARHTFMQQSGFPHGRPGYVIDHIIPLACGGKDAPENMQWQTAMDAKAKDQWERKAVRCQ